MALNSGSPEEQPQQQPDAVSEKQPSDSCSTTPMEQNEEALQQPSSDNTTAPLEPLHTRQMAEIWQTCIAMDAALFEQVLRSNPAFMEDALLRYTEGQTSDTVIDEGWEPYFNKALNDFKYHMAAGNLSESLVDAAKLRCLLTELFGLAVVVAPDIYNKVVSTTMESFMKLQQEVQKQQAQTHQSSVTRMAGPEIVVEPSNEELIDALSTAKITD